MKKLTCPLIFAQKLLRVYLTSDNQKLILVGGGSYVFAVSRLKKRSTLHQSTTSKENCAFDNQFTYYMHTKCQQKKWTYQVALSCAQPCKNYITERTHAISKLIIKITLYNFLWR